MRHSIWYQQTEIGKYAVFQYVKFPNRWSFIYTPYLFMNVYSKYLLVLIYVIIIILATTLCFTWGYNNAIFFFFTSNISSFHHSLHFECHTEYQSDIHMSSVFYNIATYISNIWFFFVFVYSQIDKVEHSCLLFFVFFYFTTKSLVGFQQHHP